MRKSGIPGAIRVLLGVVVVVALLGALIYAGTFPRLHRIFFGSTGPTYQTATISRGDLTVGVTATGPISAVASLPLTFKSSGKLADLKVNVGDKVTKGQVLATLDTTDLKANVDQANANVAVAQAQLAKAQTGATDAQKAVAQTAIDSAREAADTAQSGVSTVQQSGTQTIASARAGVNAAQTTVNTAKATLATAQDQESKGLAADQTAVVNAQKALDAVKASIAAAQPVAQQQIEVAKDALWQAQTKRDAVCGDTTDVNAGANCQNQNAAVATAETAVNVANAQYAAQQKQGAQVINQAQSQVDAAQAQVTADKAKLDAAIVQAQNQEKQAEAALATAQAALATAQAQATATTQQAVGQADQAQSAIKVAQAQYNQVAQPAPQSDADAAKAQVQAAQAALEIAQNNLDAAVLTAPFDGTVAAINGTVGQWVSGGALQNPSSALITLVSLDNLQVTAQVNEADIGKVRLGDAVTFNVAAFPDKTLNGKIVAIQPVSTTVQNVVNYNVTSSIEPSKDIVLYPGMTATVTIVSDQKKNVLLVPNAALAFATSDAAPSNAVSTAATATPASETASNGLVYLLNGRRLTPARLTLGASDGTNTMVLSGLNGGETIVLGAADPGPAAPAAGGAQRPGAGGFFSAAFRNNSGGQ